MGWLGLRGFSLGFLVLEFCIFSDRLLVPRLWMCSSLGVSLGCFSACAMALGCYIEIFGALVGLWAGCLSLLYSGCGLGFR